MSSITWLENNVFLVVHILNSYPSGGTIPDSVFHIITRQDKTTNFEFQKITDPAGPFGMERCPPHNFILRLRELHQSLQDVLIITSTAATDIGIFTKSRVPLAPAAPVGAFTMTEFSDDSRRAVVPSNDSWANTSPIGFALDLSSKTNVAQPIKGDELEESKTPLPAFMLLNNEGVLVAWWVVYNDAVRQGTIYPGLAVAPPSAAPQASPAPKQQQTIAAPARPSSAFGAQQGIGQRPSPWGTPAAASGTSAFGKAAFGSTAAPANAAFSSSAFGSTPAKPASAFGSPAFGAGSGAAAAPAFGSSGFATPKASPWGSAATPNAAFGQPTGIGRPSVFGSSTPAGTAAPTSGGFASFASASTTPFAAAVSSAPKESVFGVKTQTPSPFGAPSSTSGVGTFGAKPQTPNVFGAVPTTTPSLNPFSKPTSGSENPFGTMPGTASSTTSVFGSAAKQPEEKPGLFGQGGGFSVSSSFKPDPSPAGDDATAPTGKSLFGNNFGSVLPEVGNPTKPVPKDAEMDAEATTISKPPEGVKPSTTPSSTPAPAAKSPVLGSATPLNGSTFGATSPTPGVKPFGSSAWTFSQATDPQPKRSLFGEAKTATIQNPFAK